MDAEKPTPDAKDGNGAEVKNQPAGCLKCGGKLETYSSRGLPFDRCEKCGAIWLNEGGDCVICS